MKTAGTFANAHSYPKWAFKTLFWVRLFHYYTYAITLRYWHVIPRLKQIVRSLPPNSEVLEVGSASGEILLKLGNHVRKTGLDIVPTNVAMGNALAKRFGHNAVFVEADIDIWKGGPYDVIACVGVLQSLNNPFLTLSKMGEMLKAEGRLFLYIPTAPHKRWKINAWLARKINGSDYVMTHASGRYFEVDDVKEKAESSGLTLETSRPTYTAPGNLGYQIYLLCLYLTLALPLVLIWLSFIWWTPLLPLLAILYLFDLYLPGKSGRSALLEFKKTTE